MSWIEQHKYDEGEFGPAGAHLVQRTCIYLCSYDLDLKSGTCKD